jgi:hypothetical protein
MPIQSPPDPITALFYRIVYWVRGWLYRIDKKKKS